MGAETVATKEEPITHVEIPSPAAGDASDEVGDQASEKPSLSDLATAGFTPGEIEMAKKQGLVEGGKDGDSSNDSGGPAGKGAAVQPTDGQTKGDQNGKEKEKAKTVDERFRVLANGKSPEQILGEVSEKGALTPDQESALLAGLSQNGQALYWAQKKERLKRQKLEADLASERGTKDKEIADLKAKLAEKEKQTDDLGLDEEQPDPKKKPLTVEDLERIEAEKKEKQTAAEKKQSERVAQIRGALDDQHKLAQERYPDFDKNLELTRTIIDAANKGELETLYSDPRQRSRIHLKVVELLRAFANADAFEPGDFDAADMSYELAKEHPEFGKQLKNSVTKTDETGADGNPEKAARVLQNASRRGSSATLAGGSRRVALEELTPEQATRLPTKDFNKLPPATRERLLRGK